LTNRGDTVYTEYMFSIVYAQVKIEDKWPLAPNFTSLAGIVSYFFPKLLLVAGIICFIFVIGAGFTVLTSAGGGDPHAQEKAKNFLTLSITGLAIIFGAYWIMQIINVLTNGSLSGLGF
jgi:hypothetical protein